MVQTADKINNVVDFPQVKEARESKPVKADLDKGYTRLANELLEQSYKFPFSLIQLRAFLYIVRTTYGWRQKGRNIPNSEFHIEGISRPDRVGSLLRSLVKARVITATVGRHNTYIAINTIISEWQKPEPIRKNVKPTMGAQTPTRGFLKPTMGAQTPNVGEHSIKEDNNKEDNKDYCPVITEPPPEIDLIESQAKSLIDHLNKKANSRFQYSNASLKHARARLREGISLDDLKLIVDYKVWEWGADRKMAQYIRPKTLFSENAESYINAANQIKESGVNPNEISQSDYSQHSEQKLSTVERHSQLCNEYERKLLAEIAILEQGEAWRGDGSVVETVD